MKNILFLLLTVGLFFSCDEKKEITIVVNNPAAIDRSNEIVEVSLLDLVYKLDLSGKYRLLIKDAKGNEVAYQITGDLGVIFPVSVLANDSAVYTVTTGTPTDVEMIAYGRQYPERKDDLAWENDLVAFRAYGPALQESGEKAYGYDIWTKRNAKHPVVEERYEMELNPATLFRIDSLRKVNPTESAAIRAQTSYHVDHGNGLDCYKVGPTLGGGTSALLADGEIVYPYCYKLYEVLENGPLRFSVKLTYHPLTVKEDENVIESRIITLDAGSHLNKTEISYVGLSEKTTMVTGIVLHDDAETAAMPAEGYMAYIDPTDTPNADNGKIFVGAVFPDGVNEVKPVLFSDSEKAQRGAEGHLLAFSDYEPESIYTYYWGSGWSKATMEDMEMWKQYLSDFAQKIQKPLQVTIK